MARKPTLSEETLLPLGAEKLVRLILDEAESNAPFRKRVTAALAGTQGASAVAALIDRRLAALERARAMVAWEKEQAFAADLKATVQTIIKDLAALDPVSALHRLLRFLDTHCTVFDRIDDSSGRIQDVYWQAAKSAPDLIKLLLPVDHARLPDRLMISLSKDTHGLAPQVAAAALPFLPEAVLADFDATLKNRGESDNNFVALRQAIAETRGDLDGYLALEERRADWHRNPVKAASKLLEAKRLDEALAWVRREDQGRITYAIGTTMVVARTGLMYDRDRVAMEARILEAMDNRPAAQSLRWDAFEATLHAPTLRDYLRKLEDFIEYEEQERAFAIAENFDPPHVALSFLAEWPRLDRAAKLVLDKRDQWDGRQYDVLSKAAAVLGENFPLAASILHRILLDDILSRARSSAYGHGARHLARLELLAADITDWQEAETHAVYAAGLRKAHGRKTGFWGLVEGSRRR